MLNELVDCFVVDSVKQSKGQSLVEYLVICTALAAALGVGMIDNNSVLWQLINAFQTAYKNFSFALSIPA